MEWAGLDLNLDRILQVLDTPERASPLMKALYRRQRPRLLEALRQFPEHAAGWANLLRIDAVLGESSLSALAGVAWFQTSPGEAAMLPYRALAESSYRRAQGPVPRGSLDETIFDALVS